MDATEFAQRFRQLVRDHQRDEGNHGCVSVEHCTRCRDCTFCRHSVDLLRSHYCIECERCVDCAHCRGSQDLLSCMHTTASRRCSQSAYLERCVDCRDCHYCFGCVGLSGRDFHILNEPYERSEYFKITAALSRALNAAERKSGAARTQARR